MAELALVPQDKSEWFRCRPWIEEVVAASELYDMASIEAGIEARTMQFWSASHCMAITEILTFPKAKALNVFALGGAKGAALRELFSELEPRLLAFARAHGCAKIIGYGIKPEWRAVCEKQGYSHLWTVMAKDCG